MVTRKKPWNADMPLPPWAGGPEHEVKPALTEVTVGHSISPLPVKPEEQEWVCLRCEELDADEEPSVPDHSPRCPYRQHEKPEG